MSLRIERLKPSQAVSSWVPPNAFVPQYETLNLNAAGAGTVTITGNGTSTLSAFRTGGSASWDAKAYSTQTFTSPVTLEFNKLASATDDGQSYTMISWNTDPTSNNSYTSLDHASYPFFTNNYYVYNNGVAAGPYASWSTSNKFYLVYGTDNTIKHFNGSTQLYSASYTSGQTVYVDIAFYSVSATNGGFSNIRVRKQLWNGTAYV